ncbi:deoxyribose-phosphate aldolase [Gilliamella sp. wkB112]|uniref:deoxyribose-phosphate aldolase n=1 Tax=Gilliamella sp. wkB112 TaxID=3120257 RepID=UPI00080EC02E|nr:deoxyribose-phosphate aldolase [Gilliamella apicola]OCG02103.1 deoxyribose-phosphate aldolase [Gilliamella apicola]
MKTHLTSKALANMIDHTLLKADAINEQFKKLCDEANSYGFKMIAINSSPVKLCAEYLKDSPVHVGAAIGFPLGQTSIKVKAFETQDAIINGADEIDYVINIGELKNGNLQYIEQEMVEIVDVCRKSNVICKVILENCYLNDEQKINVCKIAKKIRPDFVKTSTGFGTSGATISDIKLMKSIVGNDVKVKAAGGIRSLETAIKMIEAGAERLGTSSGIAIINEFNQ